MFDVCRRCCRRLTSLRSRQLGFGEECRRRMRASATAIRAEYARGVSRAFTDQQVESALELITDGGIVHVGDDVFEVVSTDGTQRYLCTIFECTCPAGERDVNCYHQVASLVFQGVA